MNLACLRNASTGAILATRVGRAANWFQRAWGLLGRRTVQPDEGMWLPHCSGVHTLGMRATLDLIFLDRNGTVLRIDPQVAPSRAAIMCRGAWAVVELGCGALQRSDVLVGDRLELICA